MTLFTILAVLALLATAGALVAGIVSMAHGGDFDRRHAHELMAARVGLQGFALLLVVVALYFALR
jgi:hypothetical protein